MNAQFHDVLIITEYRSDRWFLNHDYRYTTLVPGYPWKIVVPKYFQTDLTSIPQLFQSLIPKVGRHRGPSVIHDWLVFRNPTENEKGKDFITRKTADLIFYEAMITAEVPRWKATLMFGAVRTFSLTMRRRSI